MNTEILNYQLVVLGGGLSGIASAVSSAREGVKVALITDRPVLGGNASTEIGIDINGACYNALYSPTVYARETGIIEEIKQKIFHHESYQPSKGAGLDSALLDIVYAEKNIDLFLNTLGVDVSTDNDKVKSLTCIQLASEKHFEFVAPYFIDASGDGFMGHKAGAIYRMGSESRDEFNETLAPLQKSHIVNGNTIMFHAVKEDNKIDYVRPDFAYDITKLSFFKDLGIKHRTLYRSKVDGLFHGFWWVEYGGHLNTIANSSDITLELRKIVYGLWDYIKNSGKFEDVENLRLAKVCPVAGKRESRRFEGDYILNQNDIIEKKVFSDAVFVGGWPMDVHADKGIYDEDVATNWNFVPGMFNAPYKCLYSKNISNLGFAGRDISCSRVANGSTRVMSTCCATGQAIGSASALALKYGKTYREIGQEYMAELQALLLKNDQTLMGYKESYNLGNVSIKANKPIALSNPYYETALPLIKPVILALPIIEQLNSVKVKIKNNASDTQELKVDILKGELKECYLPTENIKSVICKVGKNSDGLCEILVDEKVGNDGKVYLRFMENENLELYYNDEEVTGAPSFTCYEKEPNIRDSRRFVLTRTRHNVGFEISQDENLFDANNILSGYNRQYYMPNIYVTPKTKSAKIELAFDKKFIKEVHLIFNTDLAEDIIYNRATKLIKDYDIEFIGTDSKKETVTANYNRQNVFTVGFEVEKIVITLKENYGSKYFELFGVKVY